MVVTAAQDIDGAVGAARRVHDVHFELVEYLRAGRTLPEIDGFVAQTLRALNCTSAFHRYRIRGLPPFPSQSCLSLNDCIVHGTHTMSSDPLKPGDVISIDIGVKHQGWIGDAAWTYAIEHATDEAQRLMAAGRESLAAGIAAIRAGRPLIDWAKAVQKVAEDDYGFKLVQNLGGHGYGRKLHGPPFVSNLIPEHREQWQEAWTMFQPGMLLAVEPMLAVSTRETVTPGGKRSWPIFTVDGSLSVHYEANVLVTAEGPRDLTEGMDQLPDIVG